MQKQGSKYRPLLVDFILPKNKKDVGCNPMVDSLAVVGEETVATKCALHGLIYIWDLKTSTESLNEETKTDKIIEKEVKVLSTLQWLDTDNYFMNIGCFKGVGFVVCGDDQGSLWLYNTSTIVDTCPEPLARIVQPTTRLMWPQLQDDHLENKRKIPLDKHEIIISANTNHIVAVTNNNMVCVWRRLEQGRGEDCVSDE